jgi:hypothetical protein
MAKLKKSLAKPVFSPKKGDPVVASAPAPKKKFFGLF